jgi:hypothetical protein
MNHGSPLSKDHRVKKEDPKPKKVKPAIPVGVAKKVLKATGRPIGSFETNWLNRYMENRVLGECLPKTLLSSDLPSQLTTTFGLIGSAKFTEEIVSAFCREFGVVPEPIKEEEESVSD